MNETKECYYCGRKDTVHTWLVSEPNDNATQGVVIRELCTTCAREYDASLYDEEEQ